MIVGPRYNDVDPAVEAAYERAAEAEFECGYPEGCCEHAGRDEHGCWDCRNTGHTHETEETTPMTTSKLDAIAARLEAQTPGRQTSDVHPDDLAALLAVVREVAEIHRPGDPECADDDHDPARCPCAVSYCDACGDPAPCTTARALNRLEETDAG